MSRRFPAAFRMVKRCSTLITKRFGRRNRREFVMTGEGSLVEVQATAEAAVFTDAQLHDLIALAKTGITKLVELQKGAIA